MYTYEPTPIETSGTELSEQLLGLTERLAENVHEDWAKHRIAEGWRWGPARSDSDKTHPDLIPYSQLSESAKQYDRQAAMAMLRALIALGYRIEPGNR